MNAEQVQRARTFLSLHQGPKTLVLPNAWDVASARIFEEAGFPAIATTSAGIAFALGYPDGESLPLGELLDVVARMSRALAVPLSVDFESGYGDRPEDVARNTTRLLEAGAVGLNLEDAAKTGERALVDPSLLKDKIRATRAAAQELGVPLVINARTDVYLAAIGAPESRLERAVSRLNAYREAGADSLFAPGVSDRETISELVRLVKGPLNVLAVAGTPPISELEKLGVRRVTVGSGPMRATLGLLQRIARELRDDGTYASFLGGAVSYVDANRFFGERPKS
jgi:2-methylisocitrate lyase-like PEP mutase family enzyme